MGTRLHAEVKASDVTPQMPPSQRPTPPTQPCRRCGYPVGLDALICPRCGKNPRKPGLMSGAGGGSSGSFWVTIGGIFVILSGVVAFYSAYQLFQAESVIEVELGYELSSISCCGGLEIVFGAIAIIGGLLATMQRKFAFALIGSAIGILSLGPYLIGSGLAFIGLLFIVLNKKEFED